MFEESEGFRGLDALCLTTVRRGRSTVHPTSKVPKFDGWLTWCLALTPVRKMRVNTKGRPRMCSELVAKPRVRYWRFATCCRERKRCASLQALREQEPIIFRNESKSSNRQLVQQDTSQKARGTMGATRPFQSNQQHGGHACRSRTPKNPRHRSGSTNPPPPSLNTKPASTFPLSARQARHLPFLPSPPTTKSPWWTLSPTPPPPTAATLSATVPPTPGAASFFIDDDFAAPPFADFLLAAFSSAVGGGASSMHTAKKSDWEGKKWREGGRAGGRTGRSRNKKKKNGIHEKTARG